MAKEKDRKQEELPEVVDRKCRKKIAAREEKAGSLFLGLGVFGVVGWSVAIPTIIGALVGRWLDRHGDGRISWTLTLIFVGVVVGSVLAWKWLNQEGRKR